MGNTMYFRICSWFERFALVITLPFASLHAVAGLPPTAELVGTTQHAYTHRLRDACLD